MTTEDNTHQFPPPATDTFKQATAARPTQIERDNGNCILQVDEKESTLETSDQGYTFGVDRRVQDSNKEAVNRNQAEADESGIGGPELSTPVQRKRRLNRKWYIWGGVSIVVLVIVIVVPVTVTTKH